MGLLQAIALAAWLPPRMKKESSGLFKGYPNILPRRKTQKKTAKAKPVPSTADVIIPPPKANPSSIRHGKLDREI